MWKVNAEATGMVIKQKCVESGYTPKQISEIFGVTLTVPYLWFNGDAMPKIDNLVGLSKLFDCPIEDLLVVEEVGEENGQ